jgi:ABC-type uncharacterized transport system permease subunit
MRFFFLAALAAYIFAAVQSALTFLTKRQGRERVTLIAACVGFLAHAVTLAGLWQQEGFDALFNLRAELSVLAWTVAFFYFAMRRRWQAQAIGSFLLPLVATLMTVAALLPNRATGANELLTVEEAAWLLPVHTLLLLFAYAAFFVVFAANVMYLLQERELKSKTFGRIFHRLPSLATVEQITSTAVSLGWMLLTGGIITGMLWSATLGRGLWHNDPKEILAGLTWLLYTLLLVDRSTRLFGRGRRGAWIGIAGFALVLCTFLGARFMGGYHIFN